MNESDKKILDEAYELHIEGKYAEALTLYEMLLDIYPEEIDLLNLYARINFSLKNFDVAYNYFNKVYEKTKLEDIKVNIAKVLIEKKEYYKAITLLKSANVDSESKYRYIALAYKNAGNYKDAVSFYEKLITANEANSLDLYNLSVCYSNTESFEKALKCIKPLYDKDSENLNLNTHMAYLYQKTDDKENEIKHLKKMYEQTENTDVLYRIGILYKQLGDDEKACECFNKILETKKDDYNSLLNLGFIAEKYDKNRAIEIFEKIREQNTTDERIVLELYKLNADIFELEKALYWAQAYIDIKADSPVGYNIYADTLLDMFDYENAAKYYLKTKEILAEKGDDESGVSVQLAYVYSVLGRYNEAIKLSDKYKNQKNAKLELTKIYLKNKDFEKAKDGFWDLNIKTLNKEDKHKKIKLAFCRLNFSKAYNINESFFDTAKSDIKDFVSLYQPKIRKDINFEGKRILLFSSKGIGDLFMGTRFLKDIMKKNPSQLIFQVPESVYSLYKYNFPYIEIYTDKSVVPDDKFDCALPFFSLMYFSDIDFKKITPAEKYLSVSDDKIKEMKETGLFDTDKLKVGIYWQGNPTVMRNRSLRLKYFKPLFELDNIQLYSFQVKTSDAESLELKKELPFIDLENHIKNFEDTAALLKNIDILITVDTAIVHLAGILGLRTYLVLPYDSEWRWFDDTECTPWYNSVKIFKQKKPGDTQEVIQRIKNELSI